MKLADAESVEVASATVSRSERAPVAVGVNAMFSVQLEFAASVIVQLLLSTVKSAGLVDLGIVRPVTVVDGSVRQCELLSCSRAPVGALPNAPEAGEIVMRFAAAPACANATMRLMPCSAA